VQKLLSLVCLAFLAPIVSAGELSIHYIDVGQGDAAVVVGPDGTSVLIDGGNPGDGNADVVPYLNSIGLTGLEYSVMTHWHTDHYGGMDEVFNAGFQPSIAAYDRGSNSMPSGTQVTQYLSAVGTKRQTAFVGLTLQLGDGATLEIVSANGNTPLGSKDPSSSAQAENGRSVSVVIRYKDFDAYIGGDLTAGGSGTANIEDWAASYIGQVEVAQSSHHGSKTSSSVNVVNALDPSLVIHSMGLDNSFFHPNSTIVERWSTPTATRCQWGTTEGDTDNGSGGWTSAEGTIAVTTDGYRFTAQPAGSPYSLEFRTFEHPGVAPGPGDLAISEVMANPAKASDTYGEWLEIVNLRPELVDLGGLELRSGSKAFDLTSRVVLDYGERVVVGVDGHPSRNGDLWVPIGAPFGDFSLVNTSSNLELRNASGVLIDSLTWGTGGAFSVLSGISAERTDVFSPATAANFHDATAAFGDGDKGTPANKNTPETGVFGPGLVVGAAFHDSTLDLRLSAPTEALKFYYLGLSQGATVGLDILGLHLGIDADPLFFSALGLPGAFSTLNLLGQATVEWPLGGDPSLVGALLFAQYLTFDFALNGSAVSNLAPITVE
jgi:beta-lactamase superfamily II metal-dependent hydrolase